VNESGRAASNRLRGRHFGNDWGYLSMDRRIILAAAAVSLGLALSAMAAPSDSREADAPTPYTAEEKRTFDGLYAERIQGARRAEERVALAKELLAGAESATGGLKYLLLAGAKDLALKGRSTELALDAQRRLVDLEAGEPAALRADWLDLQVDRFNELLRTSRSAEEAKRLLYEQGARLVENALALAQLYRGDGDFGAAAQAGNKALKPATLIKAQQLAALRQSIAIDEQLGRCVSMAKGHEARGKPEEAIAEYLDAGLLQDAARLLVDHPDEEASLLVRVAQAAAPEAADHLAAAQAWDKRAQQAKGTLETIRLLRAADLYEQVIAHGDGLEPHVAKIRLQAIHDRLGDLLGALRKPAEWVYLTEMAHESASVGWGSLRKVTRKDKPCGIAGRKFVTGIYAHASSKIVYALKGRYKQFSFCYGMGTGAGGAAWFEVLGDGKRLWKSSGMWSNHTHGVRNPTVLNVVGVETLELVAHSIAGGAGAHAWWGDPKVR